MRKSYSEIWEHQWSGTNAIKHTLEY